MRNVLDGKFPFSAAFVHLHPALITYAFLRLCNRVDGEILQCEVTLF